jgi:hypothetical protein
MSLRFIDVSQMMKRKMRRDLKDMYLPEPKSNPEAPAEVAAGHLQGLPGSITLSF